MFSIGLRGNVAGEQAPFAFVPVGSELGLTIGTPKFFSEVSASISLADHICLFLLCALWQPQPTVCVTCVWASVDSLWEQEKLEARKMLENAADSHTSGARFVGRFFYYDHLLNFSRNIFILSLIIALRLIPIPITLGLSSSHSDFFKISPTIFSLACSCIL
jgi:hypothetical protein